MRPLFIISVAQTPPPTVVPTGWCQACHHERPRSKCILPRWDRSLGLVWKDFAAAGTCLTQRSYHFQAHLTLCSYQTLLPPVRAPNADATHADLASHASLHGTVAARRCARLRYAESSVIHPPAPCAGIAIESCACVKGESVSVARCSSRFVDLE